VAILLTIAVSIVAVQWDWLGFLSIPSPLWPEVRRCLPVCFFVLLGYLYHDLFTSVYNAYQEVAIAYRWQIAAQLVALPALAIATAAKVTMPVLIFSYSGVLVIVLMISGVWLTAWHRPFLRPSLRLISLEAFRRLSFSGLGFLLMSVSALFSSQLMTV